MDEVVTEEEIVLIITVDVLTVHSLLVGGETQLMSGLHTFPYLLVACWQEAFRC